MTILDLVTVALLAVGGTVFVGMLQLVSSTMTTASVPPGRAGERGYDPNTGAAPSTSAAGLPGEVR